MSEGSSTPAIDREWVRRRGLVEFVRRGWGEVEKSQALTWSWHLDAMCEALEAVTRRDIRDLVINVPPGCSKSLVTSVLWPAWVWSFDPGHRWITVSWGDKVTLRDADKMRSLIKGCWYQERWPAAQLPTGRAQSDAVSVFRTTRGGERFSTTVKGQLTGQHCDTMVVDDPIDPQSAEASSGAALEFVLEWWRKKAATRFRDHRRSARVLIMQRIHEKDLAAEMIRAGATVLCLPMRYERAHPHRWARDPRTREGELLVPERVPEDAVATLEESLGPNGTAAQLQQRPAPAGGGIFKGEWFRRWTELPPGGSWAISVDCTFKTTTDGSYVVIQVWYQQGPGFYLVDQRRERMGFVDTVAALVALSVQYPKAHKKLVEDKANGSAVVDALKRDVSGLVLVEPEGGKEARANAVQALVAAGNVYLPDETSAAYPDGRRGAPWVPAFIAECEGFPRAANDDQVDALTQFLNHAAPRNTERLRAAMANVFKPKGS